MYTNDEIIKLSIAQKSIPKYLYKYRTLNDFTDKIFTDGTMWFSQSDSFNDPFDCRFVLDNEFTQTEIIEFLKRNGIEDPDVLKSMIMELSTDRDKFPEILQDSIKEVINKTGMNCFSERNDSILMWSHYTNGHKGICLKFDIEKDTDFFTYTIKVQYKDNYTHVNYIREEKNFINKVIGLKCKDWSYEKEIRIIKLNKKGAVKFKKESLTEIIFGYNIEEKEIRRIKMLVKKNNFEGVQYKQVKLSNESYELRII